MKKLSCVLVAICFLFSCKKPQKLIYSLTATYDSTNTTGNFVDIEVAKTSGDGDMVTLSVEGLPDYITASIPPNIERAPFNTYISFKLSTFAQANVATWKNYTVTIKAVSNAGVTRSAVVTFGCYPEDATQAFHGHTFRFGENCAASGSNSRSISISNPGGNQILLVGFYSTYFQRYDVPAIIDGRKKTITIPSFTANNYTFRGEGTFYSVGEDSLACTLRFSRSTISSFDTCTGTMTPEF